MNQKLSSVTNEIQSWTNQYRHIRKRMQVPQPRRAFAASCEELEPGSQFAEASATGRWSMLQAHSRPRCMIPIDMDMSLHAPWSSNIDSPPSPSIPLSDSPLSAHLHRPPLMSIKVSVFLGFLGVAGHKGVGKFYWISNCNICRITGRFRRV